MLMSPPLPLFMLTLRAMPARHDFFALLMLRDALRKLKDSAAAYARGRYAQALRA